MRTGLSTIHQTLTPEASAVLSSSISEASRRRHSQTTPLHVAAALLSFPTGPLRQACVRSHPNSSHPLQCRALELCFSVALDRLPSSQSSSPSPSPPPLSNALMAALKRAQAHQRRGCPEQQQQPLLAVKVELEQLIVSILDDPSVSRVMREASFSSPAVKAALEQTITSSSSHSSSCAPTTTTSSASTTRALGSLRPVPNSPLHSNRGHYLNPRLRYPQLDRQSPLQTIREEEVRKVLEVLPRTKKRNPILVGDSEPEALLKEVLRRIQRKEGIDGTLQNARVISVGAEFEKNRPGIPKRIKELGETIETRLDEGVVIDLGDLKWLVEAPTGPAQQQMVSEVGKAAVAEMGALLRRLQEEEERRKVSVIGTASCATYLRCQVYHPTMEADWDLQAVPIAPMPSSFPSSTNTTGILSSSVESLTQSRAFPPIAAAASAPKRPLPDRKGMCLVCGASYEKELAKLHEDRNPLSQWLEAPKINASDQKPATEDGAQWMQKKEELLGRWKETCSRLHPNANMIIPPPPARGLLQAPAGSLNPRPAPPSMELHVSPPRSPVGTELALGLSKEHTHKTRVINLGGCTLDLFSRNLQKDINGSTIAHPGENMFKRVYKGLLEHVAWQSDAAASTAMAVAGCRSSRRRRRNDTWLLFAGPDKMGKRRMAAALSEVVFSPGGCSRVAIVPLAGIEDGDSDARYWGKVAVDRIAEAVRRSPFAVFVLEDVDRADALVQGSIRWAAEKGRIPDVQGREVSLGSAIFILTSSIAPEDIKVSDKDLMIHDEHRLEATLRHAWQLELSVERKTAKRRPEWPKVDGERQTKQKKDPCGNGELSLDLNLAVGMPENEPADSSRNSSDVTIEHERAHVHVRLVPGDRPRMLPSELVGVVDETVVFKGIDFTPLRQKVADVIRGKFELVMGQEQLIELDGEVLDVIVGGVWFGEAAVVAGGFEDWVERKVVPIFWQLRNTVFGDGDCESVVKLVAVRDSYKSGDVGGLPGRISIVDNC